MRMGDRAQNDEEEHLPCMAVKQGVRKTKRLRVQGNRKRRRRIRNQEMSREKEKKKIKERNIKNQVETR